MELIQVKNSTMPDQIGLTVKGQSYITIARVYRQQSIENYDHKRTARMIERANKINREIEFLLKQKDFCEIFEGTAECLSEHLNYIEHGPEAKPEDDNVIIKVLVPLGEGLLGEHYNIVGYTKKRAREVGLIE